MFYVVDKVGRIICNSADLEVARNLAHRIAEAGAWVAIATDDPNVVAQQSGWKIMDEQANSRLGPSKAWTMENDPEDAKETPVEKLESIVGKMNWNDGPIDHPDPTPKPPVPPPPKPGPSNPPPTVEQ